MLKKLLYRVKRGCRSCTGGTQEGLVVWKRKLSTNFRKEFLKGLLSMLFEACFRKEGWVVSAVSSSVSLLPIVKLNLAWPVFSSWQKTREIDIMIHLECSRLQTKTLLPNTDKMEYHLYCFGFIMFSGLLITSSTSTWIWMLDTPF